MKLEIFYRISDASYPKPKFTGITKEMCLLNAFSVFGHESFNIIADNCDNKTIERIKVLTKKSKVRVEFTNLGNAGSLRYAIKESFKLHPDTCVYFMEDDYFHRERSDDVLSQVQVIEEGLSIADYISLFDHPDKYTNLYSYGENSNVYRTRSTHWKSTISTTMTFATYVRTLEDDMDIWLKNTESFHPPDHKIFTEINEKGKKLISCLPGLAFHIDLTEQLRLDNAFIDVWAMDLAEEYLYDKISTLHYYGKISDKEILDLPIMVGDRKGIDKINFLGAFAYLYDQ